MISLMPKRKKAKKIVVKKTSRGRSLHGHSIYYPLCSICNYMREDREFTKAVILSTYFTEEGFESLTTVAKRFHVPFKTITLYTHCKNHMKPKIDVWRRHFGLLEKTAVMKKREAAKELMANTEGLVEAPVLSQAQHEIALDAFIAKGQKKLDFDNMPITPATFIQAIRTKAEIEKATKDRRYDALKNMFIGAAPKDDNPDM